MARNASAQEVIAARAFLKYLGRDWRSNQLVLAVIAWARVASGRLSGSLGNNPFHIRMLNGRYLAPNYGGKLVAFSSLTQGFVAAARALKYMASSMPSSYGFSNILLSLKSGQAGEFLNAVATSFWSSYVHSNGERDSSHYGLRIDWTTGKVTGTNRLISFYSTYTGLITPEAEAEARAAKAKYEAEKRAWEAQERARKAALAKFKRRPKVYSQQLIQRDYLDPYAADRSYKARHKPYELPE